MDRSGITTIKWEARGVVCDFRRHVCKTLLFFGQENYFQVTKKSVKSIVIIFLSMCRNPESYRLNLVKVNLNFVKRRNLSLYEGDTDLRLEVKH